MGHRGKKRSQRKKLQRKRHQQAAAWAIDDAHKPPTSFVFKRGKVGLSIEELIKDVRQVMRPYTADNLKERKNNKMKDFVHVAGPLGVSHFLIFSATESASYMRLATVPNGPTLTFQIKQYTLLSDITKLHSKPHSPSFEYKYPPLLLMNNFTAEDKHIQLMNTMFQKLFPPINIQTVQLAECKRVVLMSYNTESDTISFRHYLISVNPVGLSKSIKRFAVHNNIPDLHDVNDIAQYVLREANAAESDLEDGPEAQVTLDEHEYAQVSSTTIRTGKKKPNRPRTRQSAIRLMELGPRMELSLIKVEAGLCDGEVIYHQFVTKTEEEVAKQRVVKEAQKKLRDERRKEQLENLKRKGILPPDAEEDDIFDADIEQEDDDDEEEGEGESENRDEAIRIGTGIQDDGDDDEEDEEDEEEEVRDRVNSAAQRKRKTPPKPSQNDDDEDEDEDDEDMNGDSDEEEEEEEQVKPTKKKQQQQPKKKQQQPKRARR